MSLTAVLFPKFPGFPPILGVYISIESPLFEHMCFDFMFPYFSFSTFLFHSDFPICLCLQTYLLGSWFLSFYMFFQSNAIDRFNQHLMFVTSFTVYMQKNPVQGIKFSTNAILMSLVGSIYLNNNSVPHLHVFLQASI